MEKGIRVRVHAYYRRGRRELRYAASCRQDNLNSGRRNERLLDGRKREFWTERDK